MGHIVSKSSTPMTFNDYHPDSLRPNQLPQIRRSVRIEGGANVPNKHMVTPKGVLTRVSDDDLAFLMSNAKFQEVMKAGFMLVIADDRDMDKVVGDMAAKDGCAPKTEADFVGKPNSAKHVGRSVEAIFA